VQAFGARYQKHADDVLIFTNAVLGAQAQRIQLDINEFLAYETGISSAPLNTVPVQQAPVQQAPVQQAPVQQAPVQPATQPNFCMKCGAPVVPNAAFCIKCGFKLR
ncbi:MAG: zinc-ribbon domain-containing protein, partial [Ruminococcus sp.]|nr:zinc-ribbon domain-containing protein [Ruminococcus sp.]